VQILQLVVVGGRFSRKWTVQPEGERDCPQAPEGFLLPISSQRDLREFRRVLPSLVRRSVSHEPDSYPMLRVRR
jgi:hypothetical protein